MSEIELKDQESWRFIQGGRYEVSASGEVRKGDRVLKQSANNSGYMLVRLSNPRRMARVHRLVAEAFVANNFDKPFVNHIDCNRSNNVASNLEWCTQWENLRHAQRLGRMQTDYWKGKRSPNASLSDDQASRIRASYAAGGVSWADIARDYGVCKSAIGRIVRMETYQPLPAPPEVV